MMQLFRKLVTIRVSSDASDSCAMEGLVAAPANSSGEHPTDDTPAEPATIAPQETSVEYGRALSPSSVLSWPWISFGCIVFAATLLGHSLLPYGMENTRVSH